MPVKVSAPSSRCSASARRKAAYSSPSTSVTAFITISRGSVSIACLPSVDRPASTGQAMCPAPVAVLAGGTDLRLDLLVGDRVEPERLRLCANPFDRALRPGSDD